MQRERRGSLSMSCTPPGQDSLKGAQSQSSAILILFPHGHSYQKPGYSGMVRMGPSFSAVQDGSLRADV